MSLIAFIDRTWNRLVNPELMVEFFISHDMFKYNENVTTGYHTYRYLGNKWFKIVK